jgi:hypothetical protein
VSLSSFEEIVNITGYSRTVLETNQRERERERERDGGTEGSGETRTASKVQRWSTTGPDRTTH